MNRIFSTLLTMSIGAAWLILIVILLRLLLKQAPKWVNCVLWGFVGLRLVCPFVPESRFSLMPGAFRMQNRYGSAADLTLAQTPVSGGKLSQTVVDGAGAAGLTGIQTGAGTVTTGFRGEWIQQILSVGSILWLIGVIVLLGYAVYSYLRVRRQVSEAVWLRENFWVCDQVKSPFILGLLRPKIYLSSSMEEAQLSYVIAHEQAHLRRGDQWWKPLGFVLLMIHWYNPFVWVAYILFCRDLELACDESAVKDLTLEQRKNYSYALLSCSMQRRLVTVCPLAFGEVGVKKRVKEVLNYKKPSFWILLAAVAACVIVAVCFLTDPKEGTTVVLTNEAGNSEAGEEVDSAVAAGQEKELMAAEEAKQQEALAALQAEQEAIDAKQAELTAAEQEKVAAARQENTAWIYLENSSYVGYFAAKGYVAYAQAEMDGTPIFLISDGFYEDGDHTYAMSCDVYRVGEDAAPLKLGSLESAGTAYPLCAGADGFYVTSGHSIEVYNMDAAGSQLVLTQSHTEVYDENGNATYYRLDSRGQSVESTEEEYLEAWDRYDEEASPIEFTVQK